MPFTEIFRTSLLALAGDSVWLRKFILLLLECVYRVHEKKVFLRILSLHRKVYIILITLFETPLKKEQIVQILLVLYDKI